MLDHQPVVTCALTGSEISIQTPSVFSSATVVSGGAAAVAAERNPPVCKGKLAVWSFGKVGKEYIDHVYLFLSCVSSKECCVELR